MDVPEIGAQLKTPSELRAQGRSRAAIEAGVRSGALIRVHLGWYMDAAYWATLYSEGRQVAQAFAVAGAARGGGAPASHTTAAALWGMPLSRISPKHVHLVAENANGTVTAKKLVVRHRAALPDEDVTVRHGVPCTSLIRTICDLIGRLPLETAVALADAALRSIAWNDAGRSYDHGAADEWRDRARERLARQAGAPGAPQARWVLEFADGRAHLPGESISRLYLEQLGFERPRLQVPVYGPRGEEWAMDLGLDDIPAWGEFDGDGKYTDPEMLASNTTAEAVMAEKAREDWVRGSTGRPVLRWGMPHIATTGTFRRRLAAFGVDAPAPHHRIHFGAPASIF